MVKFKNLERGDFVRTFGTPIELEGQGTFTECGELYQFLKSIHPSIAYIVNEGVDLKGRSLGWSQAWSGFKERPILGWGPENYNTIYHRYVRAQDVPWPVKDFDQAHNKLVEELATKGVLGLISYLLLWAAIFWVIFHQLKERHYFLHILEMDK